jgi:hypothetical protein
MRFEVPQFIEVEDKIIGPFTWKQFVYIAGGAGALVALYLYASFFVFVLLGLPIGALAATLAFHQVNNRPFAIFLESFFNYVTKKRLYIWKKESTVYTKETTGSDEILTVGRQPRSVGRESTQMYNTDI